MSEHRHNPRALAVASGQQSPPKPHARMNTLSRLRDDHVSFVAELTANRPEGMTLAEYNQMQSEFAAAIDALDWAMDNLREQVNAN